MGYYDNKRIWTGQGRKHLDKAMSEMITRWPTIAVHIDRSVSPMTWVVKGSSQAVTVKP